MPRAHRAGFRPKVLDLIEADTPVAELAVQPTLLLGVSNQNMCNWPNRDRVDRRARRSVDHRVHRVIHRSEADPQAGDRSCGAGAGG